MRSAHVWLRSEPAAAQMARSGSSQAGINASGLSRSVLLAGSQPLVAATVRWADGDAILDPVPGQLATGSA
jgi:hypothetical protein